MKSQRQSAVYVIAGLLSLAGALSYAELAATMPREYVFMREAYRHWCGAFVKTESAGCLVRGDARCQMPDCRFQIPDSGIKNPSDSAIWNLESGICYLE